jgi:hypothetical protein
MVTIPVGYWRIANKDWDSLTKEEQDKIKQAKIVDRTKSFLV